jgi:hypothetical protein
VGSVKRTVTALVYRHLDVYNPDDAQLASNSGSGTHRRTQFNKPRQMGKHGQETDNYIRIPAIRVVQWDE